MIGSARHYDLRQWWGGRAMPMAGVGGAASLRRAGAVDAEQVLSVLGAVHAATLDCGPSTFDLASVRRDLAGDDHFSYLADDGFLSCYWDGGHDVIEVSTLCALSARTAAALWGILGSYAAQARTVRACVGPRDPIGWLTTERDIAPRPWGRWMLRVIDPVAAVAGRGFPRVMTVSVPLILADAALTANAGRYTLTVADGTGNLAKTGSAAGPRGLDAVVLGPRGFAALFAGVPMATLRVAGLADGGDHAADASLDGAFGCVPFMLDVF